MPCHPQSALAGLNARPRVAAFGVSTSRAALTARSRAMRAREPGQIRKEAALSGSGHVPRIRLARASHDASARGPLSKDGSHGPARVLVVRATPRERAFGNHRRQPGRQPVGPRRQTPPVGPLPGAGAGRRGAAGTGLRLGWRRGRELVGRARAPARVDDPGRMPRLGRRVHPGEVEVVAAAVAGIAVPADPAPGRDRLVLPRLGQVVRGRRSRPRCRPRPGWGRCRSRGRSGARRSRRGRGRSSIRR